MLKMKRISEAYDMKVFTDTGDYFRLPNIKHEEYYHNRLLDHEDLKEINFSR